MISILENLDKKNSKKINKEPLVKQFRSDSPDTYLSHVDQQKGMLLATLEDAKPKKINTYSEPKINKDLDQFAESRARYEARKTKIKTPEKIEKNLGLAGILQVSKSKK